MNEPVFAKSELRLLQQIRQNSLVHQAKQYVNWWVFGTFALLAGLTWLVNSGKIRGAFGKFVRIAEDIAVGLIYLMIGADALAPNGLTASSSELYASIVQAGLFSGFESSTAILILAALISLVTMMLTRLALDVLIWLSPVPFIDLLFETCKVVFSLGLPGHLLPTEPPGGGNSWHRALGSCFILLPWAIRLLRFGYRIVICLRFWRNFPMRSLRS